MKGILKGLATTLSTLSRKSVTVEYPDDKHPLPVRQRSFPVLTWDFDHDEPFCTGCMVCVRNCPVDCMTAVMNDNPKYATGESNRRKIIDKFWIDYGRCMRCNICVEVCNFEAIVMDNTWGGHEHATFDRRDLHLDISMLLAPSKEGRLHGAVPSVGRPRRERRRKRRQGRARAENARRPPERVARAGGAHRPGPPGRHQGTRGRGAEGGSRRPPLPVRGCRGRRRSALRIEDSRPPHAC